MQDNKVPLEDCPACGSDSVWFHGLGGLYLVKCDDCEREGECFDEAVDAARAWNAGNE